MEEILKRIADALEKIEAKMGGKDDVNQPTTSQDKPEKKEKKWKEWTPEDDKRLIDCIVLGFGYETIQKDIFPHRTVGAVKFRYYTLKNRING